VSPTLINQDPFLATFLSLQIQEDKKKNESFIISCLKKKEKMSFKNYITIILNFLENYPPIHLKGNFLCHFIEN